MIKINPTKSSYDQLFLETLAPKPQSNSIALKVPCFDELLKNTIRIQFEKKYPDHNFEIYWKKYQSIDVFPAIGNIYDVLPQFEEQIHFIMKALATSYIESAFIALKYDINGDPNLKKDLKQDNLGTAGRIAKIWGGNSLSGDHIREYADGRFSKAPRLATFPNTHNQKNPVTIKLDQAGMGSTCSHHFLPYGITTEEKSLIVISYIPHKHLIGLSKIGRFVEWCLARPSLQEEATLLIHQKIKEATASEDVYVGLLNLTHTCEVTRGAKQFSTTTTEEYSGQYKDDGFRNNVLKTVI